VEDPDEPAVAVASFAFELGVLKRIRRAGWWHAGVRDPESVAEHSLRVAQLAALLAAIEGAEPARAALLAIWHDSQETRTGDLPHTARPYLDQCSPEVIMLTRPPRCPTPLARPCKTFATGQPDSQDLPAKKRLPISISQSHRVAM
jgi:putative hydrolases of HD superfamily